MWDHYKRTFKSVQAVIAIATICIYLAVHRQVSTAAVFFLVMQLSSFVGALWAKRLQRKMNPQLW